MSYSDRKGKYQKAYNFLYDKLVPPSGRALNALGEALRFVTKVYYRRDNDGDTYGDCIEMGIVPDFALKKYPFDKEYNKLGIELDSLLGSRKYDTAMNLVLLQIMLSFSSTSNIYNPQTNRLVPIDSAAGKKAFLALDLNTVFINYCGKNEEWLPESLRKDGVKISKVLSEETRKELKCDTIQEFYRDSKSGYVKSSVKVTLSEDNAILSKQFSKIQSEHNKSVKEEEKRKKDRQKMYNKQKKEALKRDTKNFGNLTSFYQNLKELAAGKRVDTFKKLSQANVAKSNLIKMALLSLVEYKEKKVTTKQQRENKDTVIASLVAALNEAGAYVSQTLTYYKPGDTIWSDTTNLSEDLNKKIDNLLLEIYGSSDAVEALYRECCRY
jgi:hypothetical protein